MTCGAVGPVACRVIGALLALTSVARGQGVSDVIPVTAPHCGVTTPPASAGIYATPGGFIMVFPRNQELTDRHTGCKVLWVVDGDLMKRLATLYFVDGALARAVAHDVRDPAGAIEAACDIAAGRSLLPTTGRKMADSGCQGFRGEELYGLRVPTWPRSCLTKPDAAVCREDPR